MKILRIIAVFIIIGVLFTGCVSQTNQTQAGSQQQETVNIVGNDKVFVQSDAKGSELWFNQWHFHKDSTDEKFIIDKKKYDTGLGYDGITIEGTDNRGYAFIEYKIASGKYDEVSGIFGFDDNTKIKPNSKLTIFIDNAVVLESEPINESKNSIDIKVPISKDAKTIGFKIETEIKSDVIPKIVFADIKLHKFE